MTACPFCEIAKGDAYAEDLEDFDGVMVFRPLNPVTEGHMLVVPRRHVVDFAQYPEVSAEVMKVAALWSRRHTDVNVIASRGGLATQTVYHLHMHVVPRRVGDDLMLPWSSGVDQARAAVKIARGDYATIPEPVLFGSRERGADHVHEWKRGGSYPSGPNETTTIYRCTHPGCPKTREEEKENP